MKKKYSNSEIKALVDEDGSMYTVCFGLTHDQIEDPVLAAMWKTVNNTLEEIEAWLDYVDDEL